MRRKMQLISPGLDEALVEQVADLSRPLETAADLDPLLERIGDARYVLLGEASHGTSEFYTWRRKISQRLIEEKGFSFIAVEGDWPDCYEVNRFVQDLPGAHASARVVLHGFSRWPTWMWANEEVVGLAEWLREHNDSLPARAKKVGFYGLDVYSLWESLTSVVDFLRRTDSPLVEHARQAYKCFEPYGGSVQRYAWATTWLPKTCEQEVVSMLTELRRRARQYPPDQREEFFNAEQNALVALHAEEYYRTMMRGDAESWNIRDRHMAETLERLMHHYGPEAKGIVWEHNTHIGDARATDMADAGMVNVGELVREMHAFEDDVVLVGFATHRGTVIAAAEWDAPMEQMPVPPGRPGSWEDVLHQAAPRDQLLILDEQARTDEFRERRGHRAIGVVYNPEYEHLGNYVPTVLPDRYDALIFIDESQAVHPLHIQAVERPPIPETYPTGV